MKKRCNDKGFSLVELIIVIAIMAVLVGMVGAQVIPYINSTKRAKDIQILSAIQTASVAAYSEKVESAPTTGSFTIVITPGPSDEDVYTCDDAQEVADEAQFLVSAPYLTESSKKFSSNVFKGIDKIEVVFDLDNAKVTLHAYEGDEEKTEADEISAKL